MEWGERAPVMEVFQAGCGFTIGDFDVSSFTVPHDAIDPVGYTVSSQGIKVSFATDLGYIPDSLRVHFRGSDVLILESNHDLEMLRVGPYPWSVKQRVMSRRGHLSNEVVADFIRKDLDSRVSTLILGHVSEHNNHTELVRQQALRALGRGYAVPPAGGRRARHSVGSLLLLRTPQSVRRTSIGSALVARAAGT